MQLLQIEIRSALQEQGFLAVIYLGSFLGEVVIDGSAPPRTPRISKKNGARDQKHDRKQEYNVALSLHISFEYQLNTFPLHLQANLGMLKIVHIQRK